MEIGIENIQREDSRVLAEITIRYCKFPHPDVVSRLGKATFPVIRNTSKRLKTEYLDGRKVMFDDNTTPRWSLLWSHGYEQTGHPKGFTCAHVWSMSKDPKVYTHVANLFITRESFASLSDKEGPLVPYLRYHAKKVYGWQPKGTGTLDKPCGYDELEWNYFNPIDNPQDHIRRRLEQSKSERARILLELIPRK